MPNTALRTKGPLTRPKEKRRREVVKKDAKSQVIASPPQLELIPRPQRAKKIKDIRVPKKTSP